MWSFAGSSGSGCAFLLPLRVRCRKMREIMRVLLHTVGGVLRVVGKSMGDTSYAIQTSLACRVTSEIIERQSPPPGWNIKIVCCASLLAQMPGARNKKRTQRVEPRDAGRAPGGSAWGVQGSVVTSRCMEGMLWDRRDLGFGLSIMVWRK